jgi:hypothetical protein
MGAKRYLEAIRGEGNALFEIIDQLTGRGERWKYPLNALLTITERGKAEVKR